MLYFIGSVLALVALQCVNSAPGFAPQLVLSPSLQDDHPDWDPLEHASGISPYHDAPGADIKAPKGCKVTAAAFLMRHSSIYANDDEWEEYMKPFVIRVKAARGNFPATSPLAFLNDWDNLINTNNLEQLTQPGIDDAHQMGKNMRRLYPKLFPPKFLGKGNVSTDKVKIPFKVWTASSTRDIGTAKSFVKGSFPKGQSGDDGEGDGQFLTLVQVENKDPNWGASLTPHKVCPKFTKEEGRADSRTFLNHWGHGPLAKLQSYAPDVDFVLEDIIAIMMLCGYESVIKGKGKTEFCKASIFDAEDYRNFEYFFDLLYHKMVGYASPVAPYLGVHWLNTSTHNLLSADGHEGDHPHVQSADPDLPGPGGSPNSTHTQKLFLYFTHREEPPMALVALGLWNQTKIGPLPFDHRPDDRIWRTSHVLPFLGHVAIERIKCNNGETKSNTGLKKESDYIRTIVNGAVQKMDNCQSGPGYSCPMDEFAEFVKGRMEEYGDIDAACKLE